MAEGIVAGGGSALVHAAPVLDDLQVNDDYAIGVDIVRRALMTEFGELDEGLHQPSPDSSTPQSLGLGPSVG
jgi:hypothetical protein